MKRILLSALSVFAFGFMVCHGQNQAALEAAKQDSPEQNPIDMKSFISLFEIPATNISRAIDFYQSILDINIEKMEIPGSELGVFPYEGQMVSVVIIQEEGNKPSADGVTVYLKGGDNLQNILDKVEKYGGKIIVPKTAHADESGFFALFLDTEGNKLGLDSPN